MRYYLQKEDWQNSFFVLKNLKSILGLKISDSSIKQIYLEEDYSSLSAMSRSLNNWNIGTLAVKASIDMLWKVNFPAIAHLDNRFVILLEIYEGSINYLDTKIGLIKEEITDFDHKWSGYMLLIEANERSGEVFYQKSRNAEISQYIMLTLSLLLSCMVWLISISIIPSSGVSNFFFGTIGVAVSFLLLKKQFGINGTMINSFCKLGPNIDCDSVINSSPSFLLGIINLSEVGLWYFTGSILSIGLAALTSISVEPFLYVSTLIGTGLSFLTLRYQGVVLKKWCTLCLVVIAVLWLQAGFYFFSPPAMVINIKSFSVFFIGFSLPLIFWFSVRKRVIDSLKVPHLQRSLKGFLNSDWIFQKLLDDQPTTETGQFTCELQSGSSDAPIQLIVVSNPHCGPCAYTHAVLDNLKDLLDENVNIIYRFTVNASNPGTVSYQMLETLFTIQQIESNEKALVALSGWYQSNNLEKWKKLYSPTNQLDLDVTHILKEHELWCAKVVIQKTPTIIINGKLLPEEYSVTDLKFQLRKLAEKITESESVS